MTLSEILSIASQSTEGLPQSSTGQEKKKKRRKRKKEEKKEESQIKRFESPRSIRTVIWFDGLHEFKSFQQPKANLLCSTI